MSKKVIDVSSYQGSINWRLVKQSGVDCAILKIMRKDLAKDKFFEVNYKNAENSGVSVIGVYNYSYATTVAKAKADAKKVLEHLNGRKTTVWLDVEDKCQQGLGVALIGIIRAYRDIIVAAGYDFGVYTGYAFYNKYILPYGGVDCKLWIAKYGINDGKYNVNRQPVVSGNMVGWQYTSKGTVGGVYGKVDLSVWYEDVENNTVTVSHGNNYPEPRRLLKKTVPCQRGEDVKWLQCELVYHGFLVRKDIDGIFGKNTANAVGRFQKKVGITVDKKCGAVTISYLKATN